MSSSPSSPPSVYISFPCSPSSPLFPSSPSAPSSYLLYQDVEADTVTYPSLYYTLHQTLHIVYNIAVYPVLEPLNYWGKLELLRIYSQERWRERSMVCFLWKLSRGLIRGYNLKWYRSDR